MSNAVYIRTDKNGTEIYHDYTCERCGGLGGCDKWAYTGWTCYECGGSGKTVKPQIIKKYTPEYRAKLDERARKRQEKARLERVKDFELNLSEHIKKNGFNENGKLYVTVGNTYEIKEQLREAGAHWKPRLNSWVFTEKPNDFSTVELTTEECLDFNYENGWIDWKIIDFGALIQSKLPKENIVESEYMSEIGEKLSVKVTYTKSSFYESHFNYHTVSNYIHQFLTENGNVIIWKTNNPLYYFKDGEYEHYTTGDKLLLKGTVKEHSEYNGVKQTVLTRCKYDSVAGV